MLDFFRFPFQKAAETAISADTSHHHQQQHATTSKSDSAVDAAVAIATAAAGVTPIRPAQIKPSPAQMNIRPTLVAAGKHIFAVCFLYVHVCVRMCICTHTHSPRASQTQPSTKVKKSYFLHAANVAYYGPFLFNYFNYVSRSLFFAFYTHFWHIIYQAFRYR